MKHLKCLLLVLVFAAGFIPTAFTQVLHPRANLSIFSALEQGKPLSTAQERRLEDFERLFAQKKSSVREVPSITIAFADSTTTFRLQKQVWSESLGGSSVSTSTFSLESSKLVYTHRCSNIFRDMANLSAFDPMLQFISKKLEF